MGRNHLVQTTYAVYEGYLKRFTGLEQPFYLATLTVLREESLRETSK